MNICLSRWCFMALMSLFYLSKLRFLTSKIEFALPLAVVAV